MLELIRYLQDLGQVEVCGPGAYFSKMLATKHLRGAAVLPPGVPSRWYSCPIGQAGTTLAYFRCTKMVSIFILVFAVIALVRFGISQWRAIWISAANHALSDSLQLSAAVHVATI